MTYTPVNVVAVSAWGREVGAVALDPNTGYYAFEFTPAWLDTGIELAPLHMRLRPEPYEFPGLAEPTFHRLPPLLADALPDAFGNALVNAWMADQGLRLADITPLDRLAYAADRGIGALEFHPPARVYDPSATAIQLADLVAAARRTVVGDFSEAGTMKEALEQLIQVGTSAGGARAKAVIAYNPTTSQVRSGQFPTDEGFEYWLIKLDGVGSALDGRTDLLDTSMPYGRIEYAYYRMALAAGLEMSECRLLPEGPRTHFMTRRFDRDAEGRKQHLLTLCGMAHLDYRQAGTHSYGQYFQAIDALGLGFDARAQAFRRMVFNVVAVNRDDHTKNFAFLLPERGGWQLAPAYDVTHAFNPMGDWTQRHQLSVNGKFEGISVSDFYAVGEQHQVPGYRAIVREVFSAVEAWPEFAGEAGLSAIATQRITDDLVALRPN